MIVKCIAKYGKDLPLDFLKVRNDINSEHEFNIKLNKYYVVYGMLLSSGYIWYVLCDENYMYYPFWYPSPLFNVIDGRLSRYWVYSFDKQETSKESRIIWTYPEWANNKYYYNLLTDGKEEEVKNFKGYKELMDLEFPDSTIIDVAQIGDEKWLMCPSCIDAWENTNEKDAMVKCPKCQRVLHNPRYKNEWPHLNILPS